jgi:pantoate--beta-alanine ligase
VKLVTTIAEARAWRAAAAGTVGFVPTMGALHPGHLSLVGRARSECAHLAASVFVNPTQFGPKEDLARYPRDLAADRGLLADAGCDLLFAPEPADIYPAGFDTWVAPGALGDRFEGERRPGHFRGVCTVVLKLLNVVEPTRAYFGRKDAQQLAVVRRMVRDLDLRSEIVPCETVRETDGLAMSSRNAYLTREQRAAAPALKRALDGARAACQAGETSAAVLRGLLQGEIARQPLARLDYAAVVDPESLLELERVSGPAQALLAVYFGPTRLIDNLLLRP